MRYTPVKILLLSGLGGCLEFYDFIVFAIFASSISHTFFPKSSALAGLLQTFVIFAVGYLARPLGGVIMGHFGDRYGRKKIFVLTVFMMGASSLLMAIMPGFAQLGILAAILFAVLRVIQGLSLGGEVPGGLTFVAEHFAKRPGLGCGAFFLCINLGIILGNLMHSLLHWLEVSPQHSWRIAFAVGGVLALGSYFIRKTLHETPQFLHLIEDNALARLPIARVLQHCWRDALSAFCIVSAGAGMVTMVLLYMPSYLQKVLHYPAAMSSNLAAVGVIVFSLAAFGFSVISDYFLGRRGLMSIGAILLLAFILPFYNALVHHDHPWLWFVGIGVVCGLISGNFPTMSVELFPANIRFSGVALGYNLGFAVFAGLSPLTATLLMHQTGSVMSPAWIVMFCAAMAILGLLLSIGRYRPISRTPLAS